MNIVNKIRKRIKTIATLKGCYPTEIELTREEYNELARECSNFTTFIEVLDKNNQPLSKFEGVKLKIID